MKLMAVALSTFVDVGGCGCSILINARCIAVASWPFSNAEAIFYSAADATIFLRIFRTVCVGPLSFGWDFDSSSMKLMRK